jgi:Sigma-70, region 4
MDEQQRAIATEYYWTIGSFIRSHSRQFNKTDEETIRSTCHEILAKCAISWRGDSQFITYVWKAYWRAVRLVNNQWGTLEKIHSRKKAPALSTKRVKGYDGLLLLGASFYGTKWQQDPVDARIDSDTILAKCTPEDRELLELKYYSGLSNREIGLKYNRSHQAIHKRLNKVLEKLR